jgi:hypothetical protein
MAVVVAAVSIVVALIATVTRRFSIMSTSYFSAQGRLSFAPKSIVAGGALATIVTAPRCEYARGTALGAVCSRYGLRQLDLDDAVIGVSLDLICLRRGAVAGNLHTEAETGRGLKSTVELYLLETRRGTRQTATR